jgi:hypothetical protein
VVIDKVVYSELVSEKKRYPGSILLADFCRLLSKKATFLFRGPDRFFTDEIDTSKNSR